MRIKGDHGHGGFLDAWQPERGNEGHCLLTFKCESSVVKQECLSVVKPKLTASFSQMLTLEHISGGSKIEAAQEAAIGLALAGKVIQSLL